eukprot:3728388-Rhodomonas_salina.2
MFLFILSVIRILIRILRIPPLILKVPAPRRAATESRATRTQHPPPHPPLRFFGSTLFRGPKRTLIASQTMQVLWEICSSVHTPNAQKKQSEPGR